MAELLPCTCGSDEFSVYEERFLCFPKNAIITCHKCKRSAWSNSLKKAIFIWNNTRTPKERGGEK